MAARSSALALVAVAALTTACASTGAVPRPFPTPGGAAPPRAGAAVRPKSIGNTTPSAERAGVQPCVASGDASSASASSCAASFDTYALTSTALGLRGTRYRDGGSDPDGFDCSGFTQYVFGQHGLALPREVKNQFEIGQPVMPAEIAPGDLIFFSTVGPGVSHVGIALGGDSFVHAPSSTGVVRVEHLTTAYWSQRFVGARRVGLEQFSPSCSGDMVCCNGRTASAAGRPSAPAARLDIL